MVPINRGFFTSAAVSLVLVAAASFIYLPSIADVPDLSVSPQVLGFVSVLIGVVLAATIQQLTGYFTETSRKPVKDIGRSSLTGPATVILSGISLGLESAVYAALLIGGAVYGAFLIGGGAALYAVALAGCGLLTTAGVIVAMDTFGPVSDNAQGIAEMSGDIDEEGARVLTDLDAVGNTTKAITKGIAIATAVLAATALFGSYNAQVEVALDEAGETLGDAFSLVNPNNVVGAVLGAAVVFFFSGLAISAVSRAAGRVVFEVREQFRTRPGIMDYSERPDYSAVVDICTKDSLRELATPGLLAVLAPGRRRLRSRASARWRPTWSAPSPPARSWRSSSPTPAAPGTTRRRWSRTAPTAARAARRTPPPSSVTPWATRSRTPPARRSTR